MSKSRKPLKSATARELRALKRAIDDFLQYESDIPWIFELARWHDEPPPTAELFYFLKQLSRSIEAYLKLKEIRSCVASTTDNPQEKKP